jgi:hypothetical protein
VARKRRIHSSDGTAGETFAVSKRRLAPRSTLFALAHSTDSGVARSGRINQRFWSCAGATARCSLTGTRIFIFKHPKTPGWFYIQTLGHGALFQYPERFVNHVTLFLRE